MNHKPSAIYLGSDHGGYELKSKFIESLTEEGYRVVDKGAFELDPKDDYPDYISPVAREVARDPNNRFGIVVGRSGQGEAIVANRFPGVRAVVYDGGGEEIIVKTREKNNANVLSIGADFVDEKTIFPLVKKWLETPFSGEKRHIRRLAKIDALNTKA